MAEQTALTEDAATYTAPAEVAPGRVKVTRVRKTQPKAEETSAPETAPVEPAPVEPAPAKVPEPEPAPAPVHDEGRTYVAEPADVRPETVVDAIMKAMETAAPPACDSGTLVEYTDTRTWQFMDVDGATVERAVAEARRVDPGVGMAFIMSCIGGWAHDHGRLFRTVTHLKG